MIYALQENLTQLLAQFDQTLASLQNEQQKSALRKKLNKDLIFTIGNTLHNEHFPISPRVFFGKIGLSCHPDKITAGKITKDFVHDGKVVFTAEFMHRVEQSLSAQEITQSTGAFYSLIEKASQKDYQKDSAPSEAIFADNFWEELERTLLTKGFVAETNGKYSETAQGLMYFVNPNDQTNATIFSATEKRKYLVADHYFRFASGLPLGAPRVAPPTNNNALSDFLKEKSLLDNVVDNHGNIIITAAPIVPSIQLPIDEAMMKYQLLFLTEEFSRQHKVVSKKGDTLKHVIVAGLENEKGEAPNYHTDNLAPYHRYQATLSLRNCLFASPTNIGNISHREYLTQAVNDETYSKAQLAVLQGLFALNPALLQKFDVTEAAIIQIRNLFPEWQNELTRIYQEGPDAIICRPFHEKESTDEPQTYAQAYAARKQRDYEKAAGTALALAEPNNVNEAMIKFQLSFLTQEFGRQHLPVNQEGRRLRHVIVLGLLDNEKESLNYFTDNLTPYHLYQTRLSLRNCLFAAPNILDNFKAREYLAQTIYDKAYSKKQLEILQGLFALNPELLQKFDVTEAQIIQIRNLFPDWQNELTRIYQEGPDAIICRPFSEANLSDTPQSYAKAYTAKKSRDFNAAAEAAGRRARAHSFIAALVTVLIYITLLAAPLFITLASISTSISAVWLYPSLIIVLNRMIGLNFAVIHGSVLQAQRYLMQTEHKWALGALKVLGIFTFAAENMVDFLYLGIIKAPATILYFPKEWRQNLTWLSGLPRAGYETLKGFFKADDKDLDVPPQPTSGKDEAPAPSVKPVVFSDLRGGSKAETDKPSNDEAPQLKPSSPRAKVN